MLGRMFFVILFFWVAITAITPVLIRLSASANLMDYNGEIKNGDVQSSKGGGLLSRRALGSIVPPKKERSLSPTQSPSPSPSSKLHRQATFELEVSDDTPKKQNMIT